MSKSKSILLIVLSLAFLAVFEGLWLHRVWREQFENLQQETDYLFQQSMSAIQDSIARKSLSKLHTWPDSQTVVRLKSMWPAKKGASVDTIELKGKAQLMIRANMDSLNWLQAQDSSGKLPERVLMITTSVWDTTQMAGFEQLLKRLPAEPGALPGGHQVVTIKKNTIPITQVERTYRSYLKDAGLSLEFDVIYKDSLPFNHPQGAIITNPAGGGWLANFYYAAVFQHYQSYLLGKILPALLFALLLFGITTTAFFLIYSSLRQQQKLAQLKNEFISNITHELKTPITTVGVALEALNSFDIRDKPEKTREYLAHSKLELDRLSLLVEKVLRLSMFEEREPQLKPELLNLSEVVQQVTKAMTLQAERAGATIHLRIPEQEEFLLNGDRVHLSSVIFNLIDNALKYTEGNPEITVTLEKKKDRIQLQVRDNGIGIPVDLQDKVFEKFYRIQDGDRHDVKGHGLGLSYVASVVRQHGGRIWVTSISGAGSSFFVEFPIKNSDSKSAD